MPRPLALPFSVSSPFASTRSRHELPRRIGSRLAAAVLVGVIAAAAGCEEADPVTAEAMRDLNQALAFRAAGDPERQYQQIATEVAATQGISPTAGAISNDLAGDASLEAAVIYMVGDEDTSGLIAQQASSIALAERMNRLANTVAIAAARVDARQEAQSGFETVVASLRQTANTIRSGQAWNVNGEQGEVTLPTIEQTQAAIAQLQQQIEAQQQQINTLEQTRRQTLAQASEREQEVQMTTGQAAIDAARAVADLRTQAAGTTVEMTQAEAELRRLQEDLEREQALLAALEESATVLEEQARTINEGLTRAGGLQTTIEALRQSLTGVLQGAPTEGGQPPSMRQLNEQLSAARTAAEALRGQTLDAISNAEQAYAQAQQQAQTVSQEARNRQNLIGRTVSGAYGEAATQAELSLASAQRQRALVHLGHAIAESALLRLQATASGNGEAVGDLQLGDVQAAYRQAVSDAAAALSDADATIEGVVAGARGATQRAALTEQALTISAMLALQELINTTGTIAPAVAEPGVELPATEALNQRATQLLQDAQSANVSLPPIPGFPQTTTPTTPADAGTEAATQPGEATPPTAPPTDGAAPTPADGAPADTAPPTAPPTGGPEAGGEEFDPPQ